MATQSPQQIPQQIPVESKTPDSTPVSSGGPTPTTAAQVGAGRAHRRAQAERYYAYLVETVGPEQAMREMEELRDDFKVTGLKDINNMLPAYVALRDLDTRNGTKYSENEDMLGLLAAPVVQSFVCSINGLVAKAQPQKRKLDEVEEQKERSTVPLHNGSNKMTTRISASAIEATDFIDDWFNGIKR